MYYMRRSSYVQTMGWDGKTERKEHNRIELNRLKYQLGNSVVEASWSFSQSGGLYEQFHN